MTRVLAVLGSGETAPTMVTLHKELLGRLGPPPVPAVVLDTPYGFQANAAELTARTQEYFRTSVGAPIDVATFRSREETDEVALARLVARLREARYVFAGPGSPSYALRQWRGSPVPGLLADKLASGGVVTFASAAALTLGVATVPVYEIYKVGEEPRWLDGLDLLGAAGLRVAVIPHFNNAEGGTHDTRFCYLGEDRLTRLERELPEGASVLGVDEHTGLVLDLDAGSASVVGLGVVTVRVQGRATELPSGTVLGLDELRALAEGEAPVAPGVVATPVPAGTTAPTGEARSPLSDVVRTQEAAFADALERGDVDAAVGAILALDTELAGWGADPTQSDELSQARAAVHSMVVRLGELAVRGATDPAEVVGPFVDALLEARTAARADRRWTDADAIRDRLVALGVEVQDGVEGTSWSLLS